MEKKDPWLTAILNFLFGGLGFVYLGTPVLVGVGFLLFIIEILEVIVALSVRRSVDLWPFLLIGLVNAIALATLGYVATDYVNRQITSSVQATPSRLPTEPQPSTTISTSPAPSKIFCVNCGAENPADAKFCKKCGKSMV